MLAKHGIAARHGSVRAKVLNMAWPAIVDQTLAMVIGIVDTAMVGRLGAQALASVGLAAQLMQASIAVFGAVTTGTTALVARFIGAQDPEQAQDTARQSMLFGAGLAASVAAILLLFAPGVLRGLFGSSEAEVLAGAAQYVRIVALALVPNFLLIVSNGIMRGSGDTRTPMQIMALMNVVNICLNWLLIYGVGPFPALGIRGAAISTAISQTAGSAAALTILIRGKTVLKVRFNNLRPDFKVLRRVLRIGVPAGVEQIMMQSAQIIYTMIIASLGTVAYAAHRVALNAESLSFMPGFGFALAATALVGQSLGAEDPQGAERAGGEAARLAVMSMGTMGLTFFLMPQFFTSLFTNDAEVIVTSAGVLRIVGLAQPFLALTMVLGGALRGAGDTRAVLAITVLGVTTARIGVAYTLVRLGFGLVGAWIGMAVDLAVRGSLLLFRFKRGSWKHLRV